MKQIALILDLCFEPYDDTRDIERDYPNHGKECFSINVIGWKEERFEI